MRRDERSRDAVPVRSKAYLFGRRRRFWKVLLVISALTVLFALDDWLIIVLIRELEIGAIRDVWFVMAGVAVTLTNALLASAVYRALRRRPVSGKEGMVGTTGVALQSFRNEGLVSVHGEIWRAASDGPISKGQAVKVRGVEGLVLSVEPGERKA